MIFSRIKKTPHNRFEYKPRYSAEKKPDKRPLSFRKHHIFNTEEEHLAGSLRTFEHVKQEKHQPARRMQKIMLLLAIAAVIYVIYNDNLVLINEMVKAIVGFTALIILLILFININKKQ